MGSQAKNIKQISLGDDCGEVVLKVNGTRVEVNACGDVLAFTDGTVSAYKNGQITLCTVANDVLSVTADLKIGDNPREYASRGTNRATHHRAVDADQPIGALMKDGTIYAGISPDTGKQMYTIPADAPLTMTFKKAAKFAQDMNRIKVCGHDDWRVPTPTELNVLFNNRAAIGGFNISRSYLSGWYWSSASFDRWYAWGQRFSDGCQNYYDKLGHSSVRCVR